MNDEIMYGIIDLFLAGVPATDIAAQMKKPTLEILEIMQSNDGKAYADKVRSLRRMELEALADGPGINAMRDGVNAGATKERLQAADMLNKATGKYGGEDTTAATLAEILKHVMEEASADPGE